MKEGFAGVSQWSRGAARESAAPGVLPSVLGAWPWFCGPPERSLAIVSPMVPLASSGPLVIGVAVAGALVLMRLLMRSETRLEAEEEAERRAAEKDS